MALLTELKKDTKSLADYKKAQLLQRFFKTGPGEYGEGDVFIGITVPKSRKIAKKYKNLQTQDVIKLLHSRVHEERFIALLILVDQHGRGSTADRKRVYKLYLKNTKYINNWDLVDTSAHKIVGSYLADNPSEAKILDKLFGSSNLWERRISVISTFWFINQGEFGRALKVARALLHDEQDLIHKAVGWMLREVGKRNRKTEEDFLKKHYKRMPRTMLRYSIEKFPESKRQKYLKGEV